MGTDVFPAGMTADHSPTPGREERLHMFVRTGLHPAHIHFQAGEAWMLHG